MGWRSGEEGNASREVLPWGLNAKHSSAKPNLPLKFRCRGWRHSMGAGAMTVVPSRYFYRLRAPLDSLLNNFRLFNRN
ncbi:hypothetical protein GQ55_6G194600 [Panicum hallii var. hallii]|uniref:Uncharacterized protein n=1 Tax=Panicum hallii var. hallii TaxID=1504633 RepID=A0A2T7D7G1_9POAL|nr:hypothetical protein GQ55_6G194600 [Panicum hallii var. hallii]